MGKRTIATRSAGFTRADASEWNRILENKALQAEVSRLQSQYASELERLARLSRRFRAAQDQDNDELVVDEVQRYLREKHSPEEKQLSNEVKSIAKRFDIPAKYHLALHFLVAHGESKPPQDTGFPIVPFPKFHAPNDELIIKPDTDIDNPQVLDFIRQWQKKHRDAPPHPQPMQGSRKLDWRPVWEWAKRHPEVTHAEIAKALDYNPHRVRLKLAELDKGN